MIPFEDPEYVCAMRFKKGEYEAYGALDEPVKNIVGAHLILPPLSARDIEKERRLNEDEYVDVQIGRILQHWRSRSCLIDFRFVKFKEGPEADAAKASEFLSKATKFGCATIPVVDLRMNAARIEAIRAHWLSTNCGLAIRISLSDLDFSALQTRLHRLLLRLVAKPSECILILDLSDADVSEATRFSEFVFGWITHVQNIGMWRRIVVEASNYPRTNPAAAGKTSIVRRNEWIAWKNVLAKDVKIEDVAIFGDFGADHGAIDFSGGGRTITHLRYAIPESWLVVRGGLVTAEDDGTIRSVARRIIASGQFAGENFSAGDEFIAACANGLGGPGNATDWRRANMNHHMTRIVFDVLALRGQRIALPVRRRRPVQQNLELT